MHGYLSEIPVLFNNFSFVLTASWLMELMLGNSRNNWHVNRRLCFVQNGCGVCNSSIFVVETSFILLSSKID